LKNLKSKISAFLNSEEGRVGVKTPLTAGVAAGGLMFLQTMISTPVAHADGYDTCSDDTDCDDGYECEERGFPVITCCTLTYTCGTVTYAPYWSVEYHKVCVLEN